MDRVSNFYGITHEGKAKSILCTTEHAEAQQAYRETLAKGGQFADTNYRQVWLQTSTHPKEASMIFPDPAQREKEQKRLAAKAAEAKKKAAEEAAAAKKAQDAAAPAAKLAAAEARAKAAEQRAEAAEAEAKAAQEAAKAAEDKLNSKPAAK